ncbi:hypothetical protein DMH17_13320 [Raoultella planticola]|nr:hypothetical protein [Raoultella planticola]
MTIDVAYRYFYRETQIYYRRHPGARAVHPQYNTGASTCDLAILLMDARKGVLDQTRRHSFISTPLGIKTWWWR